MEDRWGYFYILSGHEAVGHCFWCGIPTKKRYCCKQHAYLYLVHYHWHEASENVFTRILQYRCGYVCELCNKPFSRWENGIEIHHIIPLNGEDRNWNVLNSPDNLLGLCKDCHVKLHKSMNQLAREKQRLFIEAQELAIQPMLPFPLNKPS